MRRRNKTPRRHGRFAGRLLRPLSSIALVAVLTLLFSRFSVAHLLEKPVADLWASIAAPRAETPVLVVDITEEDYHRLFDGRSPLPYAKLEKLIDEMAALGPLLIGVDIDTSDRQFHQLKIRQEWPPIVWAREPVTSRHGAEHMAYEVLDVLGGQDTALNRNSGLPALIVDRNDKVARTYTRMLETRAGLLPAFTWTIVDRYRQLKPSGTRSGTDRLPRCDAPAERLPRACTEPLIISYASKRRCEHCFHLSASRVAGQCRTKECIAAKPWDGKIALLGGSYTDSERNKDTPVRAMSGLEVLANVIETELEGGGQRELGIVPSLLMEFFEGLIVVFLFEALAPRLALLLSVVIIPLVAALCSLASGRPWVFFLPMLVTVLLFEWFLHVRRHLLGGVRLAQRG